MVYIGDSSYISVLVDYLRSSGSLRQNNRNTLNQAPFDHSGSKPDEFEGSAQFWDWWVRWVGKHREIKGPEAYVGFKGRLFDRMVDPKEVSQLYEALDLLKCISRQMETMELGAHRN